MSDLPEPLVPADVDLRDFPYMPVDIVRLFGSEFHARSSDAEWRAGLTLWLRSYHQVPAGSLPDDEVALTRLAELGRDIKSWRKIASGALRGWTKCSDGRLYHRTVGEKALEGWIEKLLQRKSSEAGNAKRYGHSFDPVSIDDAIEVSRKLLTALNPQSRILSKRAVRTTTGSGSEASQPTDGTPTGSPGGSPNKPPDDLPQQSQEKGREGNIERNARDARDAFEREFWPSYPHKVGKPAALRSWEKLWRDMDGVIAPILCGLERYVRDKPADRPWLNPATFLNQRRFEDQPASSTTAVQLSLGAEGSINFGGGVVWPEQTVRAAVERWRADPTSWPSDRIGPPPGATGCRVPTEFLEMAA